MVLCEFFQITGDMDGLRSVPIPFMLAILRQRGESFREAREEASDAPRRPAQARPVHQTQASPGGGNRESASVSFQDLVSDDGMRDGLMGMINQYSGKMKG